MACLEANYLKIFSELDLNIPLEGSSVDLKETKQPAASSEADMKEKDNGQTSDQAAACTDAQIQSILTAAGQNILDEEEDEDSKSTDLEMVDFIVIFKKEKHEVSFPFDHTVSKLKSHIEKITGVPASLQKIMYKGLAKDDVTLRDLKVVKGAKIMVVGSTLNDVLSVSAPASKELQAEEKASAKAAKEPLSEQKQHKKVLDKYGKPDDVPVGIKKCTEPLPQVPLSGMYNKAGGKVRLTFKMESDQLWIGTKERTDKIPMQSIKAVVSEAIKGHEDYHIMGIQLGPTEASRYWVYWVPAQYVEAVKEAILGKWQFF
ncbi:ubiquitin domain-containing protein UBFD1 isoform X2 [Aplysia californica]|uniref:Ubiquitin domain-containing protein UBFD1 isoform X2 n=1 Tax=Aplysia californica TaxID=6500 RepID=A0ABM1A3V8_APLCA|nr:ubiquitin domain-containing protein UBFD1 isoform X2 [Aplysia californica]